MKTTISYLIFLFLATGVNAQEIKTTDNHNSNEVTTAESIESTETLKSSNVLLAEDVCYSEISKVAFYEALIRQNNFDIKFENNDSNDIVLKNTEDIITNNQERISYSE